MSIGGDTLSDKLKDNPELLSKLEQTISEVMDILKDQDIDNAISYINWLKTKTELRYGSDVEHKFFILNNCIYWAHLGMNIGSEQDKHRPVLVVRTEKNSNVCTIVPLTDERLNDGYWYHVDLEKMNSTALVEQLRVISKRRIDKPIRQAGKIVSITDQDWVKIDKELRRLYNLKPLKK